MAIIATEGFDHYSTPADLNLRSGALQWSIEPSSFALTTGRGGYGKALSVNGLNTFYASFNANYTSLVFGFALTMSPGSSRLFYIGLYDPVSAQSQMEIGLDPITGSIFIYAGGSTSSPVAFTAPNAFNAGAWEFIEIAATIDNSAGSIAIQVSGATVLTYTGDTQASTHASFGAIQFVSPNVTSQIDDFRYNDTTLGPGSYACNGFMGDMRVATLYPLANNSVAWTPRTGANYTQVNETAFDGDTSYNSTSTSGAEDLFNFTALSSTISAIIAVQVVGGYREVDSGPHTLTQQLKTGGTDYPGTVVAMTTSYQFISDMFAINPHTALSWVLSDVNVLAAGYKAIS